MPAILSLVLPADVQQAGENAAVPSLVLPADVQQAGDNTTMHHLGASAQVASMSPLGGSAQVSSQGVKAALPAIPSPVLPADAQQAGERGISPSCTRGRSSC